MVKEIQVLKEATLFDGNVSFTVYGTAENPLFKAKDVSSWLGLSNTTEVVKRVDEDEVTKLNLGSLQGETWFLTENGVYEILLQSRKPKAKEFKKGIKKLLHEIRMTGSYTARPAETDDDKMIIMSKAILFADERIKQLTADVQSRDLAIEAAEKVIDERNKEIEEKEAENKELQDGINLHKQEIAQKDAVLSRQKPKVEYYDEAMASDTYYNTNQIAMELGTSAIRLNARLMADGIQYCQNGCWVLTMKYRDKGLSVVRTWETRNNDGSVSKRKPMMKWTEAGRKFILERYAQAAKENKNLFARDDNRKEA